MFYIYINSMAKKKTIEETIVEEPVVGEQQKVESPKMIEPETRFYLIGNTLIREYTNAEGKSEYWFKEIFNPSDLAVFRYGWNTVKTIKTLAEAKDKVYKKR